VLEPKRSDNGPIPDRARAFHQHDGPSAGLPCRREGFLEVDASHVQVLKLHLQGPPGERESRSPVTVSTGFTSHRIAT